MIKKEEGGEDLIITVKKSKLIPVSLILIILAVIFTIGISDVSAAQLTGISSDTNITSDNSTVTSSTQATDLKNNRSTIKNTNTSKTNQSVNSSKSKTSTSPDPQIYKNGVPVARGIYDAGHVFGSIQAAIDAAQSGDTIMLESATFYERITVDKALTFDVFGSGYATIDGSSGGRIVTITVTSGTITFNNIKFTHGSVNGIGGAILNDNDGITLILNNCSFTGNTATDGGAVYNTGTLTVTNCNFTSNSATGSGTNDGGAIWNSGTLTVTGSNLVSNLASNNGGAIFNDGGSAQIHFNRIIGNSPNNNQIRRNSGTVNIVNNWWGDNNNGSSGKVSGNHITANTWLVLTITSSDSIPTSGTSQITVDLTHDQYGTYYDPSSGHVPDGTSITFDLSPSTIGSLSQSSGSTTDGSLTVTFTAGSNPGTATIDATVDTVTESTSINVLRTNVYVSTTGSDTTGDGSQSNPYKTILMGISKVYPGGTVHIANGTYIGTNNVGITISRNVNIVGESRDSTIIDGQSANRIFIISSGYNVIISNITLKNGLASNSNGGAIQNNGGSLTLNNCAFTNNRASRTNSWDNTDVYGGAIYNTGSLTATNCSFISNSAVSGSSNDAFGGAIYSTGSLTLINSTFTSNSASSSSGTASDDGGAIKNYGPLTVTNCSFISNTATDDGGAICIGDEYSSGITVAITDSTFTSNTASYGGAIWINAGASNSPAAITGSNFTSNSAKYGGAVRNWGILTVKNSNFISNSGTYGGAISNNQDGAVLTVTSSNLTYNSATNGGAVYNEAGTAEIHFNRIIGNTGTDVFQSAGTLNAQNNWWGNNYSGSNPLTAGRVNSNVNTSTWLVLKINASPNLIRIGSTSTVTADLKYDNAGAYHDPSLGHVPDGILITFTGTLGTIPNASTVNGIATTTFTAGTKPGVAVVQAALDSQTTNTQITIGRDDVYVSPTGNDATGDGSQSNPYKTIAAGISAVYPGGTLHIASGTYNEHDLTINKSMNIVGASAASTIINAQQLGRIFNITSGTVTISNLTLANGSITGNGGAINNAGTLTVTGCNLLNNMATGSGSAIYNTGTAAINFNMIKGSGNLIASPSGSVTALNNWWGSNAGPSGKISGTVTANTWLVLNTTSSPNLIHVGGTSTVTADITHDNTGADTSSQGHIPDGIPINFISTLGTITQGTTVNGRATATFTAGSKPGIATVSATLDNQTANTQITIGRDDVYVSPTGNDGTGDGSQSNPYKTITAGISAVYPGGTLHIANGTYNEHDLIINKSMTIVGASSASTIINAQQLGRIFNITSGTVTISNLTLANGSITGNGGAINNAGTLTITGCEFLNNIATGSGGLIYNTGTVEMHFNRIIGTGNVVASPSGSVNATLNWWVSNDNPSSKVSGNVNVSTWLVLRVTASPTAIKNGNTSLVTADITHDNTGVYHDPTLGHVPDGIQIFFSSTLGSVSPGSALLVNGVATTTFTANSYSGIAIVTATGSPTVSTEIDILSDNVYVSPTGSDETGDGSAGNPYKTIAKGIEMTASNGTLHIIAGTYNEHDITINKNINIVGAGAASTIINAQQLGRIFNITSGTVTISNMTLANGSVTGNGGAINNAGTLTVTGCNLLNNTATGTGSAIYNTGTATINFNRIIGTGIVVASPSGSLNAVNNWWGSNTGPSGKTSGSVNANTWLVLNVTANTTSVPIGGKSTINANLTHNNLGVDTSSIGHVPDGVIVTFTTNYMGSMTPTTYNLVNGFASSIFTAGSTPSGITPPNPIVSVTVDNEIQKITIGIGTVNIRVSNAYAYTRSAPWDMNNVPYMSVTVRNSYSNGTYSDLNDATGVIVDYVIPAGLQYQGCSTRGWGTATLVIENGQQILRWNIGFIPAGGTVSMYVYLKVTAEGTLTTTAQLNHVDQNNLNTITKVNKDVIVGTGYVDIGVNQTVDNYKPNVGDTVTITVQASNNGPEGSNSVTVNAKLPTGLSYVDHWISYDNGQTWIHKDTAYNSATGVWTIGNYPYSQTPLLLKITANVMQTGTLKFQVNKTSQGTDYNPDNNAQTITLNPIGKGTVNIRVSNNYAYTRSAPWDINNVPYMSVTVRNSYSNGTYSGLDDATGVVVDYIIPAGLQYQSCSTRGWGTATLVIENGQQILRWNIGFIPAGGSVAMYIYLKTTAEGTLTTTAQLNHVDQNNLGTTTNIAYKDVIVGTGYVDIGVNQTVDNYNPHVGDTVTITVQASNNGPEGSNSVTVNAKLPTGLSYVDHWISYDNGNTWVHNDAAYNSATGVWTIGNYPYSQTPLLLKITANVMQTGTLKFQVNKTSQGTDYNPDNNAQTNYLIATPTADIQVEQTVNNTTPYIGDEITYTITVTNNGPNNATKIIVNDQLPSGLNFISSDTHNIGSYDPVTGLWTIESLGTGATATLTLTVQVTTTGAIQNIAIKTHETEYDPLIANDQNKITITVS